MHDGDDRARGPGGGRARTTLEITGTQYSKDRFQFDKPLGQFQVIANYLADAVTTVDGPETSCREAGWARSEGRSTQQPGRRRPS